MTLVSCSSLDKTIKVSNKNQKISPVRLPFEEKEYESNEGVFYQIVNTRSNNLNLAKQKALLSAKVLLAQQINNYIITVSKQNLELQGSNEIELFRSKSKSFSILLSENLKLVESEILKLNETVFEYWAVYSIQLNNITDLNLSQTIIDDKAYSDVLKESISLETKLMVSEKTEVNTYFNPNKDLSLRDRIEIEALAYIDVPYVWGGDSPDEGFDCSGYVQWVLKKSLNIIVPRTTRQHSIKFAEQIILDNCRDAVKGDLVYFNTISGKGISHVGIYLGNNQFIHAPNERESIQIQELDGYWLKNYTGFLPLERILH